MSRTISTLTICWVISLIAILIFIDDFWLLSVSMACLMTLGIRYGYCIKEFSWTTKAKEENITVDLAIERLQLEIMKRDIVIRIIRGDMDTQIGNKEIRILAARTDKMDKAFERFMDAQNMENQFGKRREQKEAKDGPKGRSPG